MNDSSHDHLVLPSTRPADAELLLELALASGIMVVGLEIEYFLCSSLPHDPSAVPLAIG